MGGQRALSLQKNRTDGQLGITALTHDGGPIVYSRDRVLHSLSALGDQEDGV